MPGINIPLTTPTPHHSLNGRSSQGIATENSMFTVHIARSQRMALAGPTRSTMTPQARPLGMATRMRSCAAEIRQAEAGPYPVRGWVPAFRVPS